MLATLQNNKQFWLAALVFIVVGAMSLLLHQPLLIVLPFAFVLLPLVFKYTINFTEHLFWLLFITLPLSMEINITPTYTIARLEELKEIL